MAGDALSAKFSQGLSPMRLPIAGVVVKRGPLDVNLDRGWIIWPSVR